MLHFSQSPLISEQTDSDQITTSRTNYSDTNSGGSAKYEQNSSQDYRGIISENSHDDRRIEYEYALLQQKNRQTLILSICVLIAVIGIIGAVSAFAYKSMNRETDQPKSNETTNTTNPAVDPSSNGNPDDPSKNVEPSDPGFVIDQAYTNPFFPGTSLAYSNSWTVTNDTEASQYPQLIKRTIKLTKGDSELVYTFQPKIVSGCAGDKTDMTLVTGIDNSKLSRFAYDANSSKFAYLPSPKNQQDKSEGFLSDCIALAAPIATSIDVATSPEYKAAFSGEATVTSMMTISLKSTNNEHIAEADKMISQSKYNLVNQ